MRCPIQESMNLNEKIVLRSHPFRGITGRGKVWPTFGAHDDKYRV